MLFTNRALARSIIAAAVFLAFFVMLFPQAHAEGRHHHARHTHFTYPFGRHSRRQAEASQSAGITVFGDRTIDAPGNIDPVAPARPQGRREAWQRPIGHQRLASRLAAFPRHYARSVVQRESATAGIAPFGREIDCLASAAPQSARGRGRGMGSAPGAWNGVASAGSDTSRVLAEAAKYAGAGNPTGFRGPWCKAFEVMILRRLGYHPSSSFLAIDALRDGVRVSTPRPGDIAVMPRHVTFFAGWGGRGFIGIGGNQAGHRVTESTFPVGEVIAWIEPR
jgi:hypothetical protein